MSQLCDYVKRDGSTCDRRCKNQKCSIHNDNTKRLKKIAQQRYLQTDKGRTASRNASKKHYYAKKAFASSSLDPVLSEAQSEQPPVMLEVSP